MKLYWRVKINGKWTWRPAEVYSQGTTMITVDNLKVEEEE
jgi:hypothetical protein